MLQKFDTVIVGLILGLLLPVISLFIYYFFTYESQLSFSEFINYFTTVHLFVAYVSLSCYMTNLPLFFLFIWKQKNEVARGVLFATMLYTAWVIYQKFL